MVAETRRSKLRRMLVRKTEVKFAGCILNEEGVKVDPEKVSAVTNFKTPKNITDLRQFLGMVNQLAHIKDQISETASPLRDLLNQGTCGRNRMKMHLQKSRVCWSLLQC